MRRFHRGLGDLNSRLWREGERGAVAEKRGAGSDESYLARSVTIAELPAPNVPRREILLLSLAAFASAASMRLVDAMLPRIGREFQVGLSQAAVAITVFSVAYGVTQVAFGPLGDRFGKLRVIALASLGAAAATVCCVLAPGYWGFVAARLFAGALCGAIIPMSMAWIGDVVPYDQRQSVIARFLLGQIVGLGGGAAVGGIAADQAAWRWPFAVIAAWLLVVGLLLLAASRADPVPKRAGQGSFRELLRVLERPWARIVIATVGVEGLLVFGALAFVPTHLHAARGFTLATSGLAMLAYAAGGIFFAVFARTIIARLGEVRLAAIGAILVAVGFALIGWTPVWFVAPVGCLLGGLGFYMLHNTLQANATEMAPERRGAGMALFASMLFLGQSVGVGLAGVVAESSRGARADPGGGRLHPASRLRLRAARALPGHDDFALHASCFQQGVPSSHGLGRQGPDDVHLRRRQRLFIECQGEPIQHRAIRSPCTPIVAQRIRVRPDGMERCVLREQQLEALRIRHFRDRSQVAVQREQLAARREHSAAHQVEDGVERAAVAPHGFFDDPACR